MLKIDIDLSDLEKKSDRMVDRVAAKLEELDKNNPELGVAEFVKRLSDDFEEPEFTPLEDVWQEELRRIGDKFDPPEGEDD